MPDGGLKLLCVIVYPSLLCDPTNVARYHVGESMLQSMRNFLRFIDFDDTFLQHGFKIKVN